MRFGGFVLALPLAAAFPRSRQASSGSPGSVLTKAKRQVYELYDAEITDNEIPEDTFPIPIVSKGPARHRHGSQHGALHSKPQKLEVDIPNELYVPEDSAVASSKSASDTPSGTQLHSGANVGPSPTSGQGSINSSSSNGPFASMEALVESVMKDEYKKLNTDVEFRHKVMLHCHNVVRKKFELPELAWGTAPTTDAANWAQTCSSDHPQTVQYNQNMAWPIMEKEDLLDGTLTSCALWVIEVYILDFETQDVIKTGALEKLRSIVANMEQGKNVKVGHIENMLKRGPGSLGCDSYFCGDKKMVTEVCNLDFDPEEREKPVTKPANLNLDTDMPLIYVLRGALEGAYAEHKSKTTA
ncbi:hypothetical protein CDD83_9051 [Cordyceps sp. RAO-2017]|nr:hypothetical protein CDD83_9051 [Cordyceps sp. RAO-2017]